MDLNGGWDNGAVYTTNVYPGEQSEQSHNAIEQQFVEFLRNFRLDNVFTYRYRSS